MGEEPLLLLTCEPGGATRKADKNMGYDVLWAMRDVKQLHLLFASCLVMIFNASNYVVYTQIKLTQEVVSLSWHVPLLQINCSLLLWFLDYLITPSEDFRYIPHKGWNDYLTVSRGFETHLSLP